MRKNKRRKMKERKCTQIIKTGNIQNECSVKESTKKQNKEEIFKKVRVTYVRIIRIIA